MSADLFGGGDIELATAVTPDEEVSYLWGILWHEEGPETRQHLIWRFDRELGYALPCLFKTREHARAYQQEHYGYIAHRPDLRQAPHYWRSPKVVKIVARFEVME